MNQQSAQLQHFINKQFGKIKTKQPLVFSNDTIRFIKNINGLIIQSHLEWIKREKYIFANSLQKIPKGSKFSYIPEQIQQKIDQMFEPVSTRYEFTIKSRKFRVFLTGSQFQEKKMKRCLQKIFMWLYVVNKYTTPSCAKYLDVYIYFTDLQKKIPTIDLEPMDSIHVNTAFTFSCNPTQQGSQEKPVEITVFREQEWFKVFIHETFHCLGLDFSSMNTDTCDKTIRSLFHIQVNDIRLYECYTESCAAIIHTIFYVHFSNVFSKDIENMDIIYAKIRETMANEILFSQFQCVKVLDHFGLKYDDLIGDSPKSRELSKKYSEKSQIFSYYILKSIVLFYMNDFIKWIRGSISFVKTQENIDHFCVFFREHYIDYNQNLVDIENIFENIKNNKTMELETMRMTLHEL